LASQSSELKIINRSEEFMNTPTDGGNAFPVSTDNFDNGAEGLTKRDYFAAKAMQGLMDNEHMESDDVAVEAYKQADAMLAERAKGKT